MLVGQMLTSASLLAAPTAQPPQPWWLGLLCCHLAENVAREDQQPRGLGQLAVPKATAPLFLAAR
jgi:hypothetical protein